MRELNTEIEINASAERVWQLLTDFDSYPQWNPFIRSAEGKPEPNSKLSIFVQPSGARGMKFNPTVLKAEPQRELRWLGSLLIRGLFDGEHIFIIEPLAENRVRFVQHEKFSGLLVPLFWRSLDTDTRRGFNEMNVALKERAENPKGV
jgi:hypothetical protein